MKYNIYCDESCHLEHDNQKYMVLGGIICEKSSRKGIKKDILNIKRKYNVPDRAEIKWNKVSPSKLTYYKELVDYFFQNENLRFRAIIIDKTQLNHKLFNQTHDDWYYKMYFDMLKVIFSPENKFNIYVDIKDTHSFQKVKKLQEVCCNSQYDFSARIIKKIQPIRSHEVQLMQAVDVLIGAVAYKNRIFPADHIRSQAKQALVDRVAFRSGYSLTQTTLYRENKFNLLRWESSK